MAGQLAMHSELNSCNYVIYVAPSTVCISAGWEMVVYFQGNQFVQGVLCIVGVKLTRHLQLDESEISLLNLNKI